MSRRGLGAVASVLDQAASSATNILVLVLAARLSSAAGFAEFSMVYVTFSVLLGLNMAYVGQSLVLEKGERLGAVCRSAAAFTGAASAAAGAVLAVVGLALPGSTGQAFLALGLVLPLVLLQDGLRYCFSALRTPERALAADALRLGCVVAALVAQPEGASAGRLVLVWGSRRCRRWPSACSCCGRTYGASARTCVRTCGGATWGSGSWSSSRWATAQASSPSWAWASSRPPRRRRPPGRDHPLRAAERAVQLRERLRPAGPRPAARQAGDGAGDGPARHGAGRARRGLGAVLYALPDGVGRSLLGDTWSAASALLPATGAQYAIMGLGTCALLTLRVLAPKATLSLQVVYSLLAVGLLLGGYAMWGVAGAAWGLAGGSAAKATAGWLRVARLRTPAPALAPAA